MLVVVSLRPAQAGHADTVIEHHCTEAQAFRTAMACSSWASIIWGIPVTCAVS